MALFYLAYGSNLHPYRIAQRVPSASLVGIAALPGKRLVFHKKSRDGSAKCMFVDTGRDTDTLYGAVYAIDSREKPTLDEIEGVGVGYDVQTIDVEIGDAEFETFTYAADKAYIRPDLLPYDWYRELVLLGAEYHGLPADYVAAIAANGSVADPDEKRAREKNALLEVMRRYVP